MIGGAAGESEAGKNSARTAACAIAAAVPRFDLGGSGR
jgi:hypothetical protein